MTSAELRIERATAAARLKAIDEEIERASETPEEPATEAVRRTKPRRAHRGAVVPPDANELEGVTDLDKARVLRSAIRNGSHVA